MVAKPLCPLYKNIIKPLDRARYPELRYNFTEKYVSKIYKSGQPHQNVNNLIINTCRFCINRDKWGGYKDEKFQQFTISPLKNA